METKIELPDEPRAFQHMLHPSQLRAYFAAHAPDVPGYFERRKMLTIVDNGAGGKSERMLPESDLARIARWRVEYADQMLAALAAPVTP